MSCFHDKSIKNKTAPTSWPGIFVFFKILLPILFFYNLFLLFNTFTLKYT